MNFSQRKGLTPVRSIIQKDGVDHELRVALWNDLSIHVFNDVQPNILGNSDGLGLLFLQIWAEYFHLTADDFPKYQVNDIVRLCKSEFLKGNWYDLYNFIEFVIQHYHHPNKGEYIHAVNYTLKKYLSAYRIVNLSVTDITGEEEVESIETALTSPDKYHPVKTHLLVALKLMSDRKNPDYRNSIKESISAVESLSKIITGKPNAYLKDALKEIESKGDLHPALKGSFVQLYGYTSDADGIRHALTDESNLTLADARYMLVTCSAFVNYLITKT